jgi:hypothetical protein
MHSFLKKNKTTRPREQREIKTLCELHALVVKKQKKHETTRIQEKYKDSEIFMHSWLKNKKNHEITRTKRNKNSL